MPSVECYFEGGPLDGQVQAHQDAPPTIYVKVPGLENLQCAVLGSSDPVTIQVDTVTYYRERVPHRSGCVSYFDSEAGRELAAWEDMAEATVPTGMLNACQDEHITNS